jgi:hypothetical protein
MYQFWKSQANFRLCEGNANMDNAPFNVGLRWISALLNSLSEDGIQQECIVEYRPVAKRLLCNAHNIRARNNGRMQPVSKQRLCKHVLALNTPHQQYRVYVFCVVRAEELS